MRTNIILQNILILLISFCLIMTGCRKDLEDLKPTTKNKQEFVNLKSNKINAAVGTLFGTSGVVNGTYRYGTALTSGNTVTVKVNVTTTGAYNIISNTFNGFNFSKMGIFSSTGIQYVTLQANGTPISPSINTFIVNFGSSCVFKVVVVYKNPIIQTINGFTYTYYEVANHKTLKVWLDRNIGATQVAQSPTDHLAYGSLFQWGRSSDGHDLINWIDSETGIPVNGTIGTTSSSNTPGHSLFIKTNSNPFDWRVPQYNALWQGVSGINNPCPCGYRLPTAVEINSERLSWSSQSVAGCFGTALKWSIPGYREGDGNIYESGNAAGYWSSTVSGTDATILWIETYNAFYLNEDRSIGYSIRCIKN